MPVVDPQSWKVLPFGDRDAWLDFLGQLELWHRDIAGTIRAAFPSKPYAIPPLGDGGGPEWLAALQTVLLGETTALGIAAPADLRGYDLADPDQFASWCWLMGNEHIRVMVAAGV